WSPPLSRKRHWSAAPAARAPATAPRSGSRWNPQPGSEGRAARRKPGGSADNHSMEAQLRKGTGESMTDETFYFTSESVTEGHPDKLADQISDGVLDAILEQDPSGRVACETLLTTGLVLVAGEITTSCYIEIPALVRRTLEQTGYT